MIILERSAVPQELTAAEQAKLTEEFALTSASVWNKDYIRNALLESSKFKCAYCEANVAEESKYMEVEHFRCKHSFPNLVVDWSNLLPSCKRCNGRKGRYNVDIEGSIVNPFEDAPVDHLYFQNYRLRWRNDVGRRTIEVLYLNDTERLVSVRMKIGEAIAVSLENLRLKMEDYLSGVQTVRRLNAVTRGVEALLKEAQPSSQFSALAATILLSDPDFQWMKQTLVELDLWAEFDPLYQMASEIALFP